MAFCTNCGAKNADGAAFCTSCGANLAATEVAPVEAEVVAPVEEKKKNGMGVASLICGILSLPLSCCCGGFIPGVLAIVFGVVSKKKVGKSGIATTGLILGIVGLVLTLIISVVFGFIYGFGLMESSGYYY